jgi:hypothetical protein
MRRKIGDGQFLGRPFSTGHYRMRSLMDSGFSRLDTRVVFRTTDQLYQHVTRDMIGVQGPPTKDGVERKPG